jgi:hypothetical protein
MDENTCVVIILGMFLTAFILFIYILKRKQ